MSRNKTNVTKVVAIGAILSAGVGYLAGILTAPKSGKETRKDISKNAAKARAQGEKQLKKLHSEVNDLLDDAEAQLKKAKNKANDELKEAVDRAKVAKDKAKSVLSALHDGDSEDPNLQAVVEELKLAKSNLAKYLKK